MSRAMNVDASFATVEAACAKHNVSISVLEALVSKGTRVVCNTSEGADILRRAMKSSLLTTPVKRLPLRRGRA